MAEEDSEDGQRPIKLQDLADSDARIAAASTSPLSTTKLHADILQKLAEDRKRFESLTKLSPIAESVRTQLDKQRKLLDAAMGRNSILDVARGLTVPDAMLSRPIPNAVDVQPIRVPTMLPIARNPILDTNAKLEEINERFDTMLEVMGNAAQIATTIQEHAAGFIGKFEEASKSTDQSARKAIFVGLIALGIAVISPFTPLAIQYFTPDKVVPAIDTLRRDLVEATGEQQKGMEDGFEALRKGGKSDVDRLIDELRESRLQNEALLKELQKTKLEQTAKP